MTTTTLLSAKLPLSVQDEQQCAVSSAFDRLPHLNIAVVGLGESGLSIIRWLHSEHLHCHVFDTRPRPPNLDRLVPYHDTLSAQSWGPLTETAFDGFELIIVSPGVDLQFAALQRAKQHKIPMIGDIELFAYAVRNQRPQARIVAITGSNGKTTTTSLIGHCCQAASLSTVICGNISPAALDAYLDAQAQQRTIDVYVMELSSFQLETTYSLAADIAIVLNICEDHLDRHGDMTHYIAAKQRILREAPVHILNQDDPIVAAFATPTVTPITFSVKHVHAHWHYRPDDGGQLMHQQHLFCPASLIPLTGLHNIANVLAALACTTQLGIAAHTLCTAIPLFRGQPHRVEYVSSINNIDFYDDSKGTNVGATVAALEGFPKPVILIAGGEGKGQDFSPLYQPIAKKACAVILIGRDALQIQQALEGLILPIILCDTLEQATTVAYAHAHPGQAVLLSPACASLDMFRDYQHRAEVFVKTVRQLALAAEPLCN